MNRPNNPTDQRSFVRCLLHIESQHDQTGWTDDSGDFHASHTLYTLHRPSPRQLTPSHIPMASGPDVELRDLLQVVAAAWQHPEAGPSLAASTPPGAVGLAACCKGWMLTADVVGTEALRAAAQQHLGEGLLRTHPARQEVRVVYGRLIDGSSTMVQRQKGGSCEVMPGYTAGAVPAGVAALLKVIVRSQVGASPAS